MRTRFSTVVLSMACAAALPAIPAMAQSAAAAAAQPLYQQQLAACDPTQPRPAYNACVRSAGLVLDKTGTTSSGSVVDESSDGRSTILESPGTPAPIYVPPPSVLQETTTSEDGRATLLVPSNSTERNSGYAR